jgi:hypothetical protein
MKIYTVTTYETGENDSLLGIFSSIEKAINFAQNYNQFLYKIDVEERELDGVDETDVTIIYTQIKNKDGLYFLTEDGFERPIKSYKL